MDPASEGFAGPLFLVGMPRSGTKLLRDLLCKHPRVRFSPIETEFFPRWVTRWERFGQLETREGFLRFYRSCLQLPFFAENAERGLIVDCDEWFGTCKSFTPAGIFEALMRCVLHVSVKDRITIWGDKSPSYITHVPLLIEHFPEARVIHIVRDARDYALSINKAWGKNMLRAAQRWQDDVARCREAGRKYPSAYLEVRYEDLLADPIVTLTKICAFVGVTFSTEMLTPGANTENLGDAKGLSTLLTSNVRKYRSSMARSCVTRIEKIACPTLRALSYPCEYTGRPVRLSGVRMRLLQLSDGFSLLRASGRGRGLVQAIRSQVRHFKASGNRIG